MSLADASWLPPWLRGQIKGVHHDGRCIRLQLLHLAGKRGVKNWSIDVATGDEAEQILDHLISGILDAAQEDAASLFGRQRYALCAYHERRPADVAESRIFACIGGGEGEDEDVDSEGPTQRGAFAQMQRHTEAAMRLAVGASNQLLQAQAKTLDTLSQRLTQSEAQRFQMAQMYEGMLSERHVRDLATKEHELRMKAFGDGLDKLSLLVPVAVNALAGRRILPEPQVIADTVLDSFLASIDGDQMEKLMHDLKPEQMAVLVTIMREREEREPRRKAEDEAKARATTVDGAGAAA